MKAHLTRKQSAPRNAAARALAQPRFAQKVEKDPKAYRRRQRHKTDPLRDAEADRDSE